MLSPAQRLALKFPRVRRSGFPLASDLVQGGGSPRLQGVEGTLIHGSTACSACSGVPFSSRGGGWGYGNPPILKVRDAELASP